MSSLSRRMLVLALAVLLTAPFAFSQQVFGSIYGTVTDPSGAAVANVKVTITDIDKGTSFDVTTDSSGNYNKGQLIPDRYKVSASPRASKRSPPTQFRCASMKRPGSMSGSRLVM